ncbi:uncharacterized protein LOC131655065 [Vicia villosa]|uniref:uncharacterized protein LOC131655065 n=1 Tax=Vicia villosa TaxID=3911 RepID=UPI00273C5F2A|nr:uncharacterized protein LOC131655065 [Vicia villosa]
MSTRSLTHEVQRYWDSSIESNQFTMGTVYKMLHMGQDRVVWYELIARNNARPRAVTCLWMACHRKLATKDRLAKWGLIQDRKCSLCDEYEDIDHLFFKCTKLKQVWMNILPWIQVDHVPLPWDRELQWLQTYCKEKGKRVWTMKVAIAETVYHCWSWRNAVCFNTQFDSDHIAHNIIDSIIHRCWLKKKYRDYTAQLMM